MKKQPVASRDAAALLRRNAEKQLRKDLTQSPPTPDQALRLVHELQVHQVQLELQNQSLLDLRVQLEQSLQRYTNLFDFAPIGHFTLTRDGIIEQGNLAGAAFLGLDRSQLKGRRMVSFLAIESRSVLLEFLDKIQVGEAKRQCDLCIALEDLPPRVVHAEGISLQGDDSGRCHVAMVDITGRRNAEDALRKSEERFRTMADLTWDWEYWRNPRGTLVYMSPSCKALTGYMAKDFMDNPELLVDIVHPDDRDSMRSHLQNDGGAHTVVEFRIVARDGEERWINHVCQDVFGPDGTWFGRRVSNRDITEQKRLEGLERTLREAAEAASQAKSTFLANMSHEVRTPLNSILGFAHLALELGLAPKAREYVHKMEVSATHLLDVISNVLDFSRIEAGKLQIEEVPFDLDTVLTKVASAVSWTAEPKGLEMLFSTGADVPMKLIGDALRVTQVLLNLISNAVKFTESGEIVVTTKLVERKDNGVELRFEVSDTGIGITESERSRLFQAFSQADSTMTRRFGGSGLGLAICKKLVESMHGTLDVQSEPGQGSTFGFTAAFGVQSDAFPLAKFAVPLPMGQRALVVDDNKTSRGFLAALLTELSLDVQCEASGQAALAALLQDVKEEGHHYRLVVVDSSMDGMDGMELVRQIRQERTFAGVGLLLLVAASDRGEKMRQGVGCISKPIVSRAPFFKAVSEALGGVETRSTVVKRDPREVNESIKGARVLLVEDDALCQEVAREVLEQAGLQVEVADTGREAVERLLLVEERFDVVLMDVQMPDMDGLEATRMVRLQPNLADLPIIAMTAHTSRQDRQKCLDAGMNDHLSKPMNVGQLVQLLNRWVKLG
ncbi:MAG: response regulator [Myxococcales bacterium]